VERTTVARVLALAIALTLAPPVPGEVARGFDYRGDPFAAGHHRGIDLAVAPGTPVRAACSGRVTFAGRAGANGGVVTIRCGRWNVTHLPLASLATRTGDAVRTGFPLGTAARAREHDGLHLGVRRATDPQGYVDPAPLLRTTAPRPAPPAAPRATTRRPAPPPPHPAPLPLAQPAPGQGSSPPLAPWPAWAGLALLLSGAAGARGARVRRRRRAATPQATSAPVR
jgi:hypothetical protein